MVERVHWVSSLGDLKFGLWVQMTSKQPLTDIHTHIRLCNLEPIFGFRAQGLVTLHVLRFLEVQGSYGSPYGGRV